MLVHQTIVNNLKVNNDAHSAVTVYTSTSVMSLC